MQTTILDYITQKETTTKIENKNELLYIPAYCESNPKKDAYFKRDWDIKTIAKHIRKDLKNAYPDIKISTTISRNPQSINCSIKQIPKKYLITREKVISIIKSDYEYIKGDLEYYLKQYDNGKVLPWFIDENVFNDLSRIHDNYNYDNSDSMVDYFERGYYGRVSVSYDCMII